MSQKLGNITQSDVYLNEVDIAGRLAELDLGSIEHTEVEHSSLGMIAVLALPGRPVKAIKGKLKFNWLDETLQRQLLNPTKVVKIQVHSYVDIFDEDGLSTEQSHTLVTHLKFMCLKSGGSSAKNGDQMGGDYDVSITSFVQKVYGQDDPIIEFDASTAFTISMASRSGRFDGNPFPTSISTPDNCYGQGVGPIQFPA